MEALPISHPQLQLLTTSAHGKVRNLIWPRSRSIRSDWWLFFAAVFLKKQRKYLNSLALNVIHWHGVQAILGLAIDELEWSTKHVCSKRDDSKKVLGAPCSLWFSFGSVTFGRPSLIINFARFSRKSQRSCLEPPKWFPLVLNHPKQKYQGCTGEHILKPPRTVCSLF